MRGGAASDWPFSGAPAALHPGGQASRGRRDAGRNGVWRGCQLCPGGAPAPAAELGSCLRSDFFFFPSESNGWHRSITRLHSPDLCLVLLLHLGTCDHHAVMCAQRGTGKGEPASLLDRFPAFRFTTRALFLSVSLLYLALSPLPPPIIVFRLDEVPQNWSLGLLLNLKKERILHRFQFLDFRRGIILSILNAGFCEKINYAHTPFVISL